MVAMLAIEPKVELKAAHNWDYMNEAMEAMTIDGDGYGYFCMVPSEEDFSFRYRVRFVEPRGEVPHATGCECMDRRTRPGKICKHMEITDTYYQWIADLMALPIHDTPEGNVTAVLESATQMPQECLPGDQTVQEHVIEEEMERYHKDLLFEAAHGVSSLRMRARDAGLTGLSRAGKDQLIGSLLAWRRHTLVSIVSPELPEPAQLLPTKCPEKTWTRGEIVAVLRECLGILLSVCDGAIVPDGAGCNGADAKHLRWLYRKQEWKTDEVLDVCERLQKYNFTQLQGRVPTLAIVQKTFVESANLNNSNQGFSLLRR